MKYPTGDFTYTTGTAKYVVPQQLYWNVSVNVSHFVVCDELQIVVTVLSVC
jgi:hypothetical protein